MLKIIFSHFYKNYPVQNHSKYPTFEAVISALKRNDEFKYNLVTALDDIPSGSELDNFYKNAKK